MIKMMALFAALSTAWFKVKATYKKLAPLIEPSIKRAEEMAKDGIIDPQERKKIAMGLINDMQTQGILKLGFFEKLIISRVVDWVAKKLPDFKLNVKPEDNA